MGHKGKKKLVRTRRGGSLEVRAVPHRSSFLVLAQSQLWIGLRKKETRSLERMEL